jgi:hypothetical protein
MFLNHLYGGLDEPELKIVDVFICKLRKKLASATRATTISRRSGAAATFCTIQIGGRSARRRLSPPEVEARHFGGYIRKGRAGCAGPPSAETR